MNYDIWKPGLKYKASYLPVIADNDNRRWITIYENQALQSGVAKIGIYLCMDNSDLYVDAAMKNNAYI